MSASELSLRQAYKKRFQFTACGIHSPLICSKQAPDLKYIQSDMQLGHESPKMTGIYTHVSNKSLDNIISFT